MQVLLKSGIEAVAWLAKQLSAACANRNARSNIRIKTTSPQSFGSSKAAAVFPESSS
jgi:hypothetical protein